MTNDISLFVGIFWITHELVPKNKTKTMVPDPDLTTAVKNVILLKVAAKC